MLGEFIALWKGKGFMNNAVERFVQMLTDAEYLFSNAWKVFMGEEDIEEIKQALYDKDVAVNKGERAIRRTILEHLSINPRQDISGCLAMMSLVKDAERIGDYSKNIFDLVVMLREPLKKAKYLPRLLSLQGKIAGHFPSLKKAFLDSDETIAKQILEDYVPIKDECNRILHELFSVELSSREAVGTALLTRYLKRVNSHISNITSGIIYPLDRIDFVRGDLTE